MTRIRADKFRRGELAHPRESALSAVFLRLRGPIVAEIAGCAKTDLHRRRSVDRHEFLQRMAGWRNLPLIPSRRHHHFADIDRALRIDADSMRREEISRGARVFATP